MLPVRYKPGLCSVEIMMCSLGDPTQLVPIKAKRRSMLQRRLLLNSLQHKGCLRTGNVYMCIDICAAVLVKDAQSMAANVMLEQLQRCKSLPDCLCKKATETWEEHSSRFSGAVME